MLLLSACGFEPVYDNGSASVSPTSGTQAFAVKPIPGRLGRDVRNALLRSLRFDKPQDQREFEIELFLDDSIKSVAIQEDDATTRYNYQLSSLFKLRERDKSDIIYSGTAKTEAAYNVVTSEFATLVARRDVEKRAAIELANNITNKIKLFLRKN